MNKKLRGLKSSYRTVTLWFSPDIIYRIQMKAKKLNIPVNAFMVQCISKGLQKRT